ncbi:hypothetical protein BJ742DRAFT_776767 [Cladochytrium replicatum]|nr:hypothetical protein BJ742DRAFT_776767 [Cladochytrium replicatum]
MAETSVGCQRNCISQRSSLGMKTMVYEEHDEEDDAVTPEELGIDVNGASFTYHVFARGPDQMVRVKVLQGMSPAILMMTALLPEACQATFFQEELAGSWMLEMFRDKGVFDPSGARTRVNRQPLRSKLAIPSPTLWATALSPLPVQFSFFVERLVSGMLSPGGPMTPGGYYPTRGASLDIEHAQGMASRVPNAELPDNGNVELDVDDFLGVLPWALGEVLVQLVAGMRCIGFDSFKLTLGQRYESYIQY